MARETEWGRAAAGDAEKARMATAATMGRALYNTPTALGVGALVLLTAGGYYMFYGDKRNRNQVNVSQGTGTTSATG
ncbi:hypothetical protein CDL15_Pgr015842 [Punica granatum]|uniref:Uncharacterized protein n=1 Tax=Punica granatum TaxID=22663 RepID=A0A218XQ76_PUNGR|nr:hypothetical protein CDL15_Pgr015842 [Punica granatum]PKI34003.1 hypothetical protein CRG98_045621 [Punica granatum]